MSRYNAISRSCLIAAALIATAAPASWAQYDMVGANINLDQQFDAVLTAQRMRVAQMQKRLLIEYFMQNRPRLEFQYRQYRASGAPYMSPAQFYYYDLLTAGGTDVAGGLAALRDQFAGNQAAIATVQQGYEAANAAWADRSARTTAAATRSSDAFRGNAPYVDSQTGNRLMLPDSLPAGTDYRSGGEIYSQNQSGTYYRWARNGSWVPLERGN